MKEETPDQEEIKKAVEEFVEDDLNYLPEMNTDYLEHSAEAVGYSDREQQWNTYRTIINYIPPGQSVLDYGCARGDFKVWHDSEHEDSLDYLGIDMNEPMINVGKKLYPDTELLLQDWNSLDSSIIKDWTINVGSCNLRYDADIKTTDEEYLHSTIRNMYDHANNGCVVLLASDRGTVNDDGLINWNPGDVFNWAQKEFGMVAVDHTIAADIFVLIIYKK